ncbi:transcription termination factor MTERF8, chloroplastic isoform X2 [Amborella trichopoda]|nr:transcription termination factor MTERF8, chloroplastic isoform X2 [Amborella trichopoda]XP_020520646.1 transcription termination factor MTERF8, chloroplastic isoform X2 [Amborella trichopoda]|eukprot:XP_020520645.1 transcription termination factor MTERF8, chloroplastic isoform X2 [Amborella trichopoda]
MAAQNVVFISFRSPIQPPFHGDRLTPFSLSFAHHETIPYALSISSMLSQCSKQWPSSSSLDLHTEPDLGLLSLFRGIGFLERETEYLLHENPLLLITPVESIRSRLESLMSIGIPEAALHCLIDERPEILTAEVYTFLKFAAQNLKGIKSERIERLLIGAELDSLSDISTRVQLFIDHGVPHEKLVQVLSKVNLKKVFSEMTVDEIDRVITFWKQYDIDNHWCSCIIRRPALLNLDLEIFIIPRIDFLLNLCKDESSVKTLINRFPHVLAYTVKHVEMDSNFWRGEGFSDAEFFKIVEVYPSIFSVSITRKLRPRVEFLKNCTLNKDDLFKFLIKAPLFLSLSLEGNLAKKLAFLVKMGYEPRTRELAMAMGSTTRTSSVNMQMVVNVLMNYGFSCSDILSMSKVHPQILQYNHTSLELKIDYLINVMCRDTEELLSFPAYLGYKLNDRIKRRHEIKTFVKGRSSSSNQSDHFSLNKLLSVPSKRFPHFNADCIIC